MRNLNFKTLSESEIKVLSEDETFWKEFSEELLAKVTARVSPSQVTTFESCSRKWVLSSVMGLRLPSTKAQALGTSIHAEVDHYYATGEVRTGPLEKIVRALIAIMPPRGPDIEVEEWVELDTYEGGPRMRGRGDVLRVSENFPEVFDAKSTSDVRRYGKKEHELADHTQLTIYGQAALERFKTAPSVGLTLCHVQTKGLPHTHAPTITASREEVKERYAAIVGRVKQMMNVLRDGVPEFLDVEPNTSSCGMYGGCEYKGVCGEGGRAALVLLRKSTLARKVEEAGGEAPILSFPKMEKPKREASSMDKTLDELMGGTVKAVEAKQEIKAPPERAVCEACEGRRFVKVKGKAPGAFGNCPACGGTGFALDAVEPILPPDAPPSDSIKSEGEPLAAAPKTKKARAPKETKEAPAKQAEETRLPRIIYVDCVPTKGRDAKEAVHFEEWMAPIMAKTAARLGKADYRLKEYTAEAELAIDIRAAIDEGTLPRVVIVTSLAKARATFLEQAVPRVDDVVRGV